eukprot:CAMPEP_0194744356 /NCGR_PEP_ID=MMETSP0296-20130528/100821_1 /TAXON_ID=39354 /ORGANISM="Heterosigma akashiwo, Strain CCMP2393" /LENGTH=224 /DNA_ID=CAMNT_0039656489 /DNA_START=3217 /DNA_END=3888 /DNA_ORIENTATION=+
MEGKNNKFRTHDVAVRPVARENSALDTTHNKRVVQGEMKASTPPPSFKKDPYPTYCEHQECNTRRPWYNFVGEQWSRFCGQHKLEGMVHTFYPPCAHEGCDKRSDYGPQGALHMEFCEEHKLEGMVWDEHPTPCQHPGCGEENPEYFLWEGFEPGEMFCLHHWEEGMVHKRYFCPDCQSANCEWGADGRCSSGKYGWHDGPSCTYEGCDEEVLYDYYRAPYDFR